MRKLIGSVVIAVCALAGAGILLGTDSEPSKTDIETITDQANPGEVVGSAAVKSAKEVTKPKIPLIEEGDWEVAKATDVKAKTIAPGTYIILAKEDGFGCYWAMVKNFDQTLNSIIVNGNVEPGKTNRVNIKSTYAGLQMSGDCFATLKK